MEFQNSIGIPMEFHAIFHGIPKMIPKNPENPKEFQNRSLSNPNNYFPLEKRKN
jgi:hypothetical protein